MTREELSKIPFKPLSHMSMETEHCMTYTNEEYGIAFCTHVPVRWLNPHGRCYRHYWYKGIVYKSVKKLLEAINAE